MKRYIIPIHLFFLIFFILGVARSESSNPVSLDALIDEALKNNPQVQAAYSSWQVGKYKARQAGNLPDPNASYTYFGESVETRVGPQEHKYGVSQKFPFPGKLNAKAKAQLKSADMLKQKYEAQKREIIKNVKFVYYDMFWTDKAIQISEEEKAVLENTESVAQKKYESNTAGQQDVIKAQIEISKMIDRILSLKQNRKSLAAKMNSILSRPMDTEIAHIQPIEVSEFNYQLNDLRDIAQASQQELLAAALDVERAKYEKSMATLDFFPDFTLGFDYIQVGKGHTAMPNDGEDAWTGTVMVNVPIWFDKQASEFNEKKAALEASNKTYKNAENTLAYEIEDLYFKIAAYRDINKLYETALMPQTEQSFDTAKAAYEAGKIDFLNWLDSERILLQTRLAYYKSIVDYQKSIAYLERVVGKDLK